jgi:tetratricopeptide (TPR) repeat protein/predicted aspartyl protease
MGGRLVRTRHLGYLALLAAFCASTAVAGQCQLQKIGEMPVDMQGLHPLVTTKINGAKARFLLDTGSFYSTMWRDAAARYQLPVTPAPGDSLYIEGVGGREKAEIATIKSFEFLGVPLSKVQFLVVNQGSSDDPAGLIGQNLLRISDVEYDLANGAVRFFKPVGCDGQPLAYWAVSTPYTSVKLQSMYVSEYHLSATAVVSGRRMRVWFDTGASRSLLSLDAAARIGITPSSPGVTFLGTGGGIGMGAVKMWIAPVASFQLGGEKVEHAHLLIADLEPRHPVGYVSDSETPDMLLGDDFFLSHRIYVAYSQHKIYFTYNGGPLFNLNLPQVVSGRAKPPTTLDASTHAAAAPGAQAQPSAPADADGLRRQGMAYASMQEFDRAIADLTRACELAPGDAENYYDRGLVYSRGKQLKPALKDFDAAIKLQPDDIDAHLARALLLQSQPDVDPAATSVDIRSDLDVVSRLAPPAASVRLMLGSLYGRLGDYRTALSQIDQWLDTHRLKSDQAIGLNNRCWLRARANRDLRAALDDCNEALDLTPYVPGTIKSRIRRAVDTPSRLDALDSRGLVYLRLGRPNAAMSDYDDALEIDPNLPTSLYGRGLAELRLGRKARGRQDLAAAEKLDGGIAKRFAGMGLTP